MKRFKEAYDVVNNMYEHISNENKKDLSVFILARTLTELSRAELGLGDKESALNHASEAVDALLADENKNNKNIKNLSSSEDLLLARALVSKSRCLKCCR